MNKLLFFAIAFTAYSFTANSQTFDPDFGNGGKVITSLGAVNWSNIYDAKFLPDGKILTCGTKDIGLMTQLVVARYLQNGILDPDFGTAGMTLSDLGTDSGSAAKLWLLPDGKFFVAGEYREEYWAGEHTNDFMLVRYTENGVVDNTFGENGSGFVTVDASAIGRGDMAHSMILDDTGRIILVGRAGHDCSDNISYCYMDFAVVRLNGDGTIDNTFADNGIFKTEIGDNTSPLLGSVDYAYEVKIQIDGKIVVCGVSDATSAVENYHLAMVRLNENGTLDQTFGLQGKVLMNLGGRETFRTFQIFNSGKILAIGNSYDNVSMTGSAKLVRLNIDGTPDTTFGNNGIATSGFDNSGSDGVFFDSYLYPNGKILACGTKQSQTNLNAMIMRFNVDGTLDQSFGTDGVIEYDFMNGDDFAIAIDVNASGDFIACGGSNGNTEYNDFTLAKFLHEDLSVGDFQVSGFSISPNPFTDFIDINTKGAITKDLELTLFDNIGRQIKTFLVSQNAQNLHLSMPDNLSKGIYYLSISDGKNSSTRKIIKQ